MGNEWFTFDGVNWIAVLVAFLAVFAVGWVWYSPAGFWKTWREAGEVTDERMKDANMGAAFGGTIVANVLGIIVLAVLMGALEVTGWLPGLLFGGLIGLVYRAGAHLIHNGFALRKPIITLVDSAHDISGLAIAGAILGAFG